MFYDHYTIFFAFSIVFSKQRFSNCSSIMDVGFIKLSLDYFGGNRVFEMNTVTFAAVVYDF